jgi:hypothetical protein
MCALVQGYVKEAFSPGNNGTWSTFFNDGDQPSLSQALEVAWYRPGKLDLVRDNLTILFFNLESFALGGRWLSLLGLPDMVLALPKDRIWKYLLFGRPYLNYLSNKDLEYSGIGSMSGGDTGWQSQKRLLAIESLVLLLWFLASGFALRMRNGGDFVTAFMRRTRSGRLSAWDAMNCCILELYHLIWLDVMIGFMLQNL